MFRKLMPAALAVLLGTVPAVAQQSGVIGSPPPQDLMFEVRKGPDGGPVLSTDEFTIMLGAYYRFNFICADEGLTDDTGFHFEANDLLANSHLRVVSVGDMEIYLQGMAFRALECDEKASARFSFHAMRRGVYQIYVRDHSDPPKEAFARVVVE